MLCTLMAPAAIGLVACDNGKTDIGILQYGAFDALDNARKGFIDGLKEGGFGNLKIDYQNAQADAPANATLAKGLAAKNHRLNLAIATPCATAMKAAQEAIGSTTPDIVPKKNAFQLLPVSPLYIKETAAPSGIF